MNESDDSAVRAARAGDTRAFERLVDRHKNRLFAMLVRLTGDAEAAEELAHEAFVRAYRGLARFRGEASFGTWLIQIAVNLARDRVRERRRDRTVSLDALLERDEDSPVFTDSRPGHDALVAVTERDLIRHFESALQELPPAYREAFVMHHIEDMPYAAIAEATGDSVGSLKVRVHRARRLLKEKLFPAAARMATGDVIE